MPSLMLLEHVFGSWSMMSFPMPWKRRLAVPSGCRMSSSRPSMMTSWSVWAMQRRPIRMTGSADRHLCNGIRTLTCGLPASRSESRAPGAAARRDSWHAAHLRTGHGRADRVLGDQPPRLALAGVEAVPWARGAVPVGVEAFVDGSCDLVLRVEADHERRGLRPSVGLRSGRREHGGERVAGKADDERQDDQRDVQDDP